MHFEHQSQNRQLEQTTNSTLTFVHQGKQLFWILDMLIWASLGLIKPTKLFRH